MITMCVLHHAGAETGVMDVPSNGVPPTTSLSQELARRGVDNPGDLITSIMMFTERSKVVGPPPLPPGTPSTPGTPAGAARGGGQSPGTETPQAVLNTGMYVHVDTCCCMLLLWQYYM